MSNFGLLPTGFRRKTAGQIRDEIFAALRGVEGFENIRTGGGSVIDNIVAPFASQMDEAWQGTEAVYQSLSPDMATFASLDNLLAIVGNARLLEARTTVDLCLVTTGSSNVLVQSENQVAQAGTGTLFETVLDATIPANTLELDEMPITDIEWVGQNSIRYTVTAADLSGVVVGDIAIVEGAANTVNNGVRKISAVDDTDNWVEIENLLRSDDASDETGGTATLTITNGWVMTKGQSIDFGPFEASAYSVSSINTPLSGWDYAINLKNGLVGRDVEGDTTARRRRQDEITISDGGTMAVVIDRLMNPQITPGVDYASGIENVEAYEVGGLPPHSMLITVVGGEDQDIWNTIGLYKGAGIKAFGTEVGTYTSPTGDPFIVGFNRVIAKYAFIGVTIYRDAGLWPSDGVERVKQALVDYGRTLAHGQDLINLALGSAVWEADIPGLLGATILQGFSDPPTLPVNLPIAPGELCIILAGNIAVALA